MCIHACALLSVDQVISAMDEKLKLASKTKYMKYLDSEEALIDMERKLEGDNSTAMSTVSAGS